MGRLKILEVNRVFQSPLRGSATFLVITGGLRHRLISNGPPGLADDFCRGLRRDASGLRPPPGSGHSMGITGGVGPLASTTGYGLASLRLAKIEGRGTKRGDSHLFWANEKMPVPFFALCCPVNSVKYDKPVPTDLPLQ